VRAGSIIGSYGEPMGSSSTTPCGRRHSEKPTMGVLKGQFHQCRDVIVDVSSALSRMFPNDSDHSLLLWICETYVLDKVNSRNKY
jgi:hypothetical protein